jgi:uncharacterized repeat protein (TIGR01451 family)
MSNLFKWLRRILLASLLGIAATGILAFGTGWLPVAFADGGPLDGSTKSVAPDAIYAGDTVTFTIVLSNSSLSDVSATVIDPRPTGLSFLSGTGPGTLILSTDAITWTGNVTAQQSVSFSFQARADSSLAGGTLITNTAVISDGVNSLERSATLNILARVYFPIIMQRWPPIPYPVVLNPIDNAGYGSDYIVTWQAAELATSYILQEDDNNGFSSPQEYDMGAALSQAFTDKPGGRYYYRVRGVNTWGYGDWSNIESTLVGYFSDDFSNSASGWRIAHDSLYTLGYINGWYSIYVPLDFRGGGHVDSWFDQPAVLAPMQPPSGSDYCVSVDTYFASTPGWWEQHSLIFGASADLRTLYRLETNVNGDWAVSKYTKYTIPYGGIHAGDTAIIDWHEENGQHVRKDQGLNHLKVIVKGTTATFYINGATPLDYATGLNDLPYLNRVGVIGGSYEVTPVDSRFDNFMWSTDINMCP